VVLGELVGLDVAGGWAPGVTPGRCGAEHAAAARVIESVAMSFFMSSSSVGIDAENDPERAGYVAPRAQICTFGQVALAVALGR
jgi:hypothetical protein